MPSYIIKPDPDRDFYVMYSTIVDSWTMAGTRAEMLEDPDVSEERLLRADLTGTSAIPGFYSYAEREKWPTLLFRDVGDECDSYEVPYGNLEELITELHHGYEGGMKQYTADEKAIYDKHGTIWKPED